MSTPFPASIVIAVLLIPAVVVHCFTFPATLMLERGIPQNHTLELSQLRERDRYRHSILLDNTVGAVDFPVGGLNDPLFLGLYFAKVRMGTPPKDYHVQIDTGSDVMWVNCNSCKGCPAKTELGIPLSFYDPGKSSSATLIPCWKNQCSVGFESSDSFCFSQKNQCAFALNYSNGNAAYGYYVLDSLLMSTLVDQEATYSFSAPIVFGCSIRQTGNKTNPNKAVDGVFGFGQQKMSVISQLAGQSITPNVFSHCLKGDGNGGGYLVIGEVVAPNLVYTPLAPSQSRYEINLQSISVKGKLAINQTVLQTSTNMGTIVDSGTALAYLAQAVYDPLLKAITANVLKKGHNYPSGGKHCYLIYSSIDDLFPQISFNFAGNASMVLNPKDYLLKIPSLDSDVWCIGFQEIPNQQINVLGDLVLKDKIVVYDIKRQRIGWISYNCNLAVNVSATTNLLKGDYNANEGDFNVNSSVITMIALLLHVFTISSHLFF